MRLPLLIALLLFGAASTAVDATGFLRPNRDDAAISSDVLHRNLKKEEESYWTRLMQETDMSVAPTPRPPTPVPPTPEPPSPTPPPPTSPAPTPETVTPDPTPSPIDPPTEPPVEPTPAPVEPTPSPVEPTTPSPTESPEAVPSEAPPTTSSPTESPEAVPTEAPPTGSPPTDSPPTVPGTPVPTPEVTPEPPSLVPPTDSPPTVPGTPVPTPEVTPEPPSLVPPTDSPPTVPGTPVPTPEVTPEPPSLVPPTDSPPTAPVSPSPTPDDGLENIAEIIEGDDRFTVLVSLLNATDLLPALAGPGDLTLFAPTNAAFEALNLPADTPLEEIQSVLLYHVVGSLVLLIEGEFPYVTLNGEELVVSVTETATVNDVNIEESIPASNGIVYVIDAVLIPPGTTAAPSATPPTSLPPTTVEPGQTMGDIVRNNPNYARMENYLIFTEILPLLDEPGLNSTFFVPTNEAFQVLEDAGLAALLLTGFWIEHTECVVRGTFVPELVPSSDFFEGLVLPTYEENENLTITLSPVTRVTSTGRGANITSADIIATNGILHEIDRTMLPTCMTKSIGEIGREDPNLSILFELADLAPSVNFTNPIGLTVFAPTNEAFAALGPEVLDALRDPNNLRALESFLLHHAFNGNIYSSGLIQVLPTRSISVENTSAYWYMEGDVIKINGADIIQTDVLGRNGVYHVINEVMLPPSILELLADLPEYTVEQFSFTSLLAALTISDLDSALEVSNLNDPLLLTLFAPTDEAFADAPEIITKFSMEGWIFTHLREVLLYHAATGRLTAADVVTMPTIEAANGDLLTVTDNVDTVMINNATVVSANNFAYNGAIHAISEVLIPETMTQDIVTLLSQDENFSILVEALGTAGLTDDLEGPGPLTLFAPTNAAFDAIADVLPGLTVEELTEILLYHVAAENVILVNDEMVLTLEGSNVLITRTEDERKVNDANIEEDRVLASNGIIFAIDAVLIPPEDVPPTVAPTIVPPPGSDCALGVSVSCTSEEGVDCSEAFPASLQCDAHASSLTMKYNGGNCDQSFNRQTALFFGCADGRNGMEPNLVDQVFIDVETDDFTSMFQGFVNVGDVFRMTFDGGQPLPFGATISIFRNSTMSQATRLQTVKFNPSCVESIVAMNNKFGAAQVVGWENAVQGSVDSTIPQTLLFNYNVVNTGTTPSTLQFLESNDVRVDYTNVVLQPGESNNEVTIPIPNVALDDGEMTISVSTTVFGTDDEDVESECIGSDESEFIVGFV